jgi:hypothetical protein
MPQALRRDHWRRPSKDPYALPQALRAGNWATATSQASLGEQDGDEAFAEPAGEVALEQPPGFPPILPSLMRCSKYARLCGPSMERPSAMVCNALWLGGPPPRERRWQTVLPVAAAAH